MMRSLILALLLAPSVATAATTIDDFNDDGALVLTTPGLATSTDSGGVLDRRDWRLIGQGSMEVAGGLLTVENTTPGTMCCFDASLSYIGGGTLNVTRGKNEAINLWIRELTGTWTVAVMVRDSAGATASYAIALDPGLVEQQDVIPYIFGVFEGYGVNLAELTQVRITFLSTEEDARIVLERVRAARVRDPR